MRGTRHTQPLVEALEARICLSAAVMPALTDGLASGIDSVATAAALPPSIASLLQQACATLQQTSPASPSSGGESLPAPAAVVAAALTDAVVSPPVAETPADAVAVVPVAAPTDAVVAPPLSETSTDSTAVVSAAAPTDVEVDSQPILDSLQAPPVPTVLFATTPVPTVTTVNMQSFNELRITGTATNDTISVTQSGNVLTVVADGVTTPCTGLFGDLAIHAGSGGSTITIDASVNITTLIYGGAGNDTIVDNGTGKAFIVTIGGGSDTVTGNGINTSYWVDPSDTVNASAAEIAAGGVHVVNGFYQPWSTTFTNVNYVPLELQGQNLKDPTDSGTTTVLANRSLWGAGPTMSDVNQGQTADCYFVATVQSMANQCPGTLEQSAVDLGDGTYAVQFVSNGQPVYVRVDGTLPCSGATLTQAHPGTSGDLWAPIMEKAYAYYRSGANTYASLNSGSPSGVFYDLGIAQQTLYLDGSATTLVSTIDAKLAAGKAFVANTNTTITNGIPIVANHSYTVVAVSGDGSAGTTVTVRNPWGYDGFNDDSNPLDGLVTLTLAQFQSAFTWGNAMS